ncbi:hypothetical protein COOONC_03821 [Cooperia oncophora]
MLLGPHMGAANRFDNADSECDGHGHKGYSASCSCLIYFAFSEQQSNEIPDAGDNFPITLVEPEVTPQHPDPGNVAQEDTSSIEGSIPLEAVPSMDVTPVETEGNDTLSEVESEHKTPLRKSVDSDPGDFVKIDDADNGNSDEHNAGALKAKVEEADGGRSDGQNAGVVESKDVPTAVVNPLAQEEEKKGAEVESGKVESSQETLEKKSAQKSPYENFLQWMEKNPAAVSFLNLVMTPKGWQILGCLKALTDIPLS